MKKILLTLLLPALLCTAAFAQNAAQETVTFRFVPGEDMFYIPWSGNDAELNRLYSLVDEYRTDITAGRIPIHVDGYCASLPTEQENRHTAFVRANRVKSELITNKGLVEENFVTKNHTTAYDGHKDMVVVTLRIPAQAEPDSARLEQERREREAAERARQEQAERERTERERVEQERAAREQAERDAQLSKPEPAQVSSWRRDPYVFSLRTNLLYDAFLVPNIGLEWRINRHLSVQLNYGGSYWGDENGKVQKIWLVSPEVRWYTGERKRFYVGASANFGEYNTYGYLLGKLYSDNTGYQGELWNAGLTVGYQLYLSRSFSLDFNLGLGYTKLEYDSFSMQNEKRTYKDRDNSKNFWGPTQGGVSLIWTIGGTK